MAIKKSKNNPENRISEGKKFCKICGEIRKPILIVKGTKKKTMCFECKCGILDKTGKNHS